MFMSIQAKGEPMSKIKEELQRIYEKELEEYICFMEWVCDQTHVVSEHRTKEEQESSNEPSSPSTSIVHQNTLKAVNIINYNPLIGA